MSLGIVVKSPSGLVLAVDSRVTLQTQNQPSGETLRIHFDNATKLLRLSSPHNFVGAVTFGQAVVPSQNRTAESFVPEFEGNLGDGRLSVEEYAQQVLEFYRKQWGSDADTWNGSQMTFYVAGFNESEPYGRVFKLDIPRDKVPVEQHTGGSGFGASWGRAN